MVNQFLNLMKNKNAFAYCKGIFMKNTEGVSTTSQSQQKTLYLSAMPQYMHNGMFKQLLNIIELTPSHQYFFISLKLFHFNSSNNAPTAPLSL